MLLNNMVGQYGCQGIAWVKEH